MLTNRPLNEKDFDPESFTRTLFRKMEAALEQSNLTQFNRLAQERHAFLLQFRDAQGRPTLSARLLSDLLSENRHWTKELDGQRTRLSAEMDRERARKNTCLALAHAYGDSPPSIRYVSHRG